MNIRRLALVTLLTWVPGCALLRNPFDACQRQAPYFGPDLTVVGSFTTTVGRVRAALPRVP
jgi:hypothetical protein